MRKQSLSHEDFLILRSEGEAMADSFVEARIALYLSRLDQLKSMFKRLAFGWSGGKDSQALYYVCHLAGVHDCVLGMSNMEYPAFLSWVTDNMPEGLTVVNTGLDVDWLIAHPEQLFPANSSLAGNWFKNVQHKAQHDYVKSYNVDCLILGRRLEDGNYVGKGSWVYKNHAGVLRASPMFDSTHSELFAIIAYANKRGFHLPDAPFYSWPRGYRCGTHSWAARQWCESHAHAWGEIEVIDPSIPVYAADRGLQSAVDYLEGK